jgi:uncharacterized membrane protein
MMKPKPAGAPVVRGAALVVFVTLLKPFSNLFLAWGMRHHAPGSIAHPLFYLNVIFDPLVTTGVLLQCVWLLARMSLLSIADLSFVLPVTAAGYGISTLLGRFALHEQVSWSRWIGAVLISLGTGLAAGTSRNTTSRVKPTKAATS